VERERAAEYERRKKVLDDVPRSDVRLGAVVRIHVGDAFTEAIDAVTAGLHDDEGAVVDAPEARFEERDERKPDEPQPQPFDSHTG
jgi:hypothetical protein